MRERGLGVWEIGVVGLGSGARLDHWVAAWASRWVELGAEYRDWVSLGFCEDD